MLHEMFSLGAIIVASQAYTLSLTTVDPKKRYCAFPSGVADNLPRFDFELLETDRPQ